MNLLIVRHAESKGNASGNYSVATHDSLSAQGEKQASFLAACLGARRFDKILVSPLQRALETVSPYLVATSQRAEIWPEMAEACWQEHREAPSECWKAQPASLPAAVAHLFDYWNDQAVMPALPESFGEGLRRVHVTRDRLQEMAAASDCSVLMITHGHFINELLNLILDIRNPVGFPHDNCGMTMLTYDRVWTVRFCNRTSDPGRSNVLDTGGI